MLRCLFSAPKGHGKIARGFQPLGPECERGPGAESPWLLTIAPVGARNPRSIKTAPARGGLGSAKCQSRALLASASGSAGRNATLVTLSTRPVISAAVLLDLARWCQQRLAFTEDGTPCGDPQIDLKHPPFCASTHEGQETGHSQLATTGRLHAQDLLVLLATMIGHHVPSSHAGDGKGVPDESY